MKADAVLFDLDDTLLSNSVSKFLPRYFSLLSEYAQSRFVDGQRFLQELMIGTQAMIANSDGLRTNREIFWELFQERTGQNATEMERFFDRFYETRFPELRNACELRPAAAEVVRYCFTRRVKVVIATNPVFPRRAVEHRLIWAGLPVQAFDFALVTSYDNMHAAKPNEAYYKEILEQIDVSPGRAIMIGDDWQNDIVPAHALGIVTYWIADEGGHPPEPDVADGFGSLEESQGWLQGQLGTAQ